MTKHIIFIPFMFLLLTGVSCSNITFSTKKATDGGVYKSLNRGEVWEQKVFVEKIKKKITTIAHVNVKRFVPDPEDSRIIYLITRESGLWKTTDGAGRWSVVYQGGGVSSLALDARDASRLYMAVGNRIMTSGDGGNTWEEVYLEPRPTVSITSLVINLKERRHVIASTSAGDILESRDEGGSWKVVYRFDFPIGGLLQLPKSNYLFATTQNQGVWRSVDEGKTWKSVSETLKEYAGALEVKTLIPDPATPNALLLATVYGIFRTTNNGDTWQSIPLISKPGTIEILSLAVNPKNSSHLYYTVSQAFYASSNGGARWTTLPVPSGKLPTALSVDAYNPDILYLGFTNPKK
ncbi:MAG: hypothetical protein AB1352_04360 [Patescibacteria group bacterium]